MSPCPFPTTITITPQAPAQETDTVWIAGVFRPCEMDLVESDVFLFLNIAGSVGNSDVEGPATGSSGFIERVSRSF